jgi:hypothetical protein
MQEEIKITVTRYRHGREKHPTCAIDFDEGLCCRFLATQRFGTVHSCFVCDGAILERDKAGYLKPTADCPLFQNE